MSLPSVLESVRTLPDLQRLVAGLGYESTWLELPSDTVGLPGASAGVAAPTVVGVRRDFTWFACASTEPAITARRWAHRLATRGRFAGVLALDPTRHRLAIAVAGGGEPCRTIDLSNPSTVDLQCLDRLRCGGTRSALGLTAAIAEALSVEEAGARFFRAFRGVLNQMSQALPSRIALEDRHGLALLQLTRVLFLYFVQSKGWLDGRPHFLREEVDRCLTRRGHLHRDFFRPLFFGTLNRPELLRSGHAAAFGAIPFLNGGLFESHPVERRWRIDIPTASWREAFDDLFEHFQFVTAGATGTTDIAPDMLGRVFEGVMDPSLRHESGTFYTPPKLAGRLLRTALIALLMSRLGVGIGIAERRVDDPDPATEQLFARIRILDPAVGSGAFLLSALELLSGLPQSGLSVVAHRRWILAHNLFGVDQNPNAVRLTELRLWLAVIAAEPSENPRAVNPLPNLDSFVRSGDSLLEPKCASILARVDRGRSVELADRRATLALAQGDRKRELITELQVAERQILADALGRAMVQCDRRRRELMQVAKSPALFGEARGLDRAEQKALDALTIELRELRGLQNRLRRDGSVPWFHYESHFADVFAGGGFDLVVGNPPWVRAEALSPGVRRQLHDRYRWWGGRPGQRPGFRHQPDVSVAFLERAFELTAPGGVVAFILPQKLRSSGYAEGARTALVAGSTLNVVADLSRDPDAAFDATVYPLALVATQRAPHSRHRVRGNLAADGPAVPQRAWMGGAPWIVTGDATRATLDRIRREYPSLVARFSCHLGVKTGANDVFLNPQQELESCVLRWALRGRDVRPFSIEPRCRLVWPHDDQGRVLRQLPPRAAAYFAQHEARLRRRRDYDRGPIWTLFRVGRCAAAHRVVWPDMAKNLSATVLSGPSTRSIVPLNTCYVTQTSCAEHAYALATWLNSTWVRVLARLHADVAQAGYLRFNARVVRQLPLPDTALADAGLVQIYHASRGGINQTEIDEATAPHLSLTPRDRRRLAALLPDNTAGGR